jgi:hypothetical protein
LAKVTIFTILIVALVSFPPTASSSDVCLKFQERCERIELSYVSQGHWEGSGDDCGPSPYPAYFQFISGARWGLYLDKPNCNAGDFSIISGHGSNGQMFS